MKNKGIILVLILSIAFQGFSQSFDVRRIFNSGAGFGTEYLMPSKVNDSTDFLLTKYKVQFVKVLSVCKRLTKWNQIVLLKKLPKKRFLCLIVRKKN